MRRDSVGKMKTLDEVIKAYELSCGKKDCAQCPYNDECLDHFTCECYERMDDTFHYLKEYQTILPLLPNLINTAITVQKKGKTIG